MAYVKSDRGIGQMLVMPGMLTAMGARAEKVAARARATAPVDEDGKHPGQYRDGIEVRVLVRPKSEEPPRAKKKEARACGRVVATAPHSAHVEFGDEKRPAHRTLRNALDAAKE